MKIIKNSSKILHTLSLYLLVSCTAAKVTDDKIPSLKLLDVYEISNETQFENTKVGGLSGIDYDEKSNSYYIISDDRSEYNPARIYQAKINIGNSKINSIDFTKVISLKNNGGKPFVNNKIDPKNSLDPEDVRYFLPKNELVWSNEGERLFIKADTILQNPSITISSLDGNYISQFQLPKNLNMQRFEKGPRRNGVLEGLSFADHHKKLYANIEEPLFEDGKNSNINYGGIVRFFEFDTKTLQNEAQYFYALDPVAKTPIPENAFSVNGISGILNYQKQQFLVIERSYSTGYQQCTVKLFFVDFKNAPNVINVEKATKELASKSIKKLVLNLDSLGIYVDNVEGITFGPTLENGKRSLLLITDNNFSEKQKTQVLLFEISE